MNLPIKILFQYFSINVEMRTGVKPEGAPEEVLSFASKSGKGNSWHTESNVRLFPSFSFFFSPFSHAHTPNHIMIGVAVTGTRRLQKAKIWGRVTFSTFSGSMGTRRMSQLSFFIYSCHLVLDKYSDAGVHRRARWIKPHVSSQKTKMMSPRNWKYWGNHQEKRIWESDSIKLFMNLWAQFWAQTCKTESIHHIEDFAI